MISTDDPKRALGLRRRLGWVVAALAMALGAVALGLAASTAVWTLGAGEATGEVVALDAMRDASGEVRVPAEYRAVIEFPDHNGQFRRFDDPSTTRNPPPIGSEVKVLYDRRRPAKARIEDHLLLYGDAITAGVWALGIGVVAEELLRGAQRHRSPRPRGRDRPGLPG